MAADLSTLTGFAFRYRVGAGYVGGGDDVVAWGTSLTDDAGSNSLAPTSGTEKHCPSSSASGISMISTTRTSNGSLLNLLVKTTGTNLPCAGMGVVMIGRMAGGTYGSKRNICCVGTGGGGGEFQPGVSAAGLLTVANSSDVTVRTSNLRMPCGLTCAAWQVSTASGGSSFMKVLGVDAYTGSGIASAANNAWLRLFHDGGANGRWPGAIRELVFFNTATAVSSQIAAIEAYARENIGLTVPTKGNVICLGDSYGEGAYAWFADYAWPGEVARALPDWFTVNNCRSGYTLANIYTNRATLIDAAEDRGLGSSKPLMFVVNAGRNDWITGRSLVNMQADAVTLASYLRTTYPSCSILFFTQEPTGVVSGGGVVGNDTIRRGFNDWLRAGGLAAYSVGICDVAAISAFVPAGTDSTSILAVANSSNYTIYDTTPAAANDLTHLGPTGQAAQRTTIRAAAQGYAPTARALVSGRARRFGRFY